MRSKLEHRTPDLLQFLFRATGDVTDVRDLSLIDVFDNVTQELDRIAALAELLKVREEELAPENLVGLGLLLEDVEKRIRGVLDFAMASKSRVAAASPRPSRHGRSPSSWKPRSFRA